MIRYISRITIEASEAETLEMMREWSNTFKSKFCFQNVIPYPTWLVQLDDLFKAYNRSFSLSGKRRSKLDFLENSNITKDIRVEGMFLNNSTIDGILYEWRMDNWGIGTEAYNVEVHNPNNFDTNIIFNTDGDIPIVIVERMARRFPQARFVLETVSEYGSIDSYTAHIFTDGFMIRTYNAYEYFETDDEEDAYESICGLKRMETHYG